MRPRLGAPRLDTPRLHPPRLRPPRLGAARLAAPTLAVALALGCVECVPRGTGRDPGLPPLPRLVRVQAQAGGPRVVGTLVRLTGDSVWWAPGAVTAGEAARETPRADALAGLARVEVGDPKSLRALFARGWLVGGAAGAVAGGALLAARRDAAGGAIALTLGVAHLGGILNGQTAEGANPARAWRVVHPAPR